MTRDRVKYEIQSNDAFGRFLVASEDIAMGEIIFKDQPLVVGPKMKSELICFACHIPISKKFFNCSSCKVAIICNKSCDNNEGWHTKNECHILANLQNKLQLSTLIDKTYIIMIIRCIMLRENKNKDIWKNFMSMECHLEMRRNTPIWNLYENMSTLLDSLGLLNEDDKKIELLQKICGILDVNSFELRVVSNSGEGGVFTPICGIYPLGALMAHNCVANTHLAIDEKCNMFVRASLPIAKGEIIYYNYTNVLQGTINRREHLREGKYFNCNCNRCSDATELGTNLSTLKCTNCNNYTLTMSKPLNISQLKFYNTWMCRNCNQCYTGEEIKVILNKIQHTLADIDNSNPSSIEKFLVEACKILHHNHCIVLEVKHLLAGLLREILNTSVQQSKKILIRKLEICKNFIPILEVLEPGISRLKAITLYELHIPMAVLANKDYDAKEISSDELLDKLNCAEKNLKEAIRLLLFEPMNTPEGKLCRRAMEELKMLQKSIEDAKNMVDNESKKNVKQSKRKNKKH